MSRFYVWMRGRETAVAVENTLAGAEESARIWHERYSRETYVTRGTITSDVLYRVRNHGVSESGSEWFDVGMPS